MGLSLFFSRKLHDDCPFVRLGWPLGFYYYYFSLFERDLDFIKKPNKIKTFLKLLNPFQADVYAFWSFYDPKPAFAEYFDLMRTIMVKIFKR